jgi:hypothetical protein
VVTIELFESEVVIARGTRRTSWRVRVADAWISVNEHPTARVENVEAGPGTVWERRVELDLESGTRLERVEASPAPERAEEPLSYLKQARPRRAWRSQKREYRVGPRGELQAQSAKRRGPG